MAVTATRLRIAIIGLAGCGKSTSASLIQSFAAEQGLSFAVVKLAAPLYRLQSEVYRAAGVELMPGSQDQLLMESLADAMRRIRPDSLARDFLKRLVDCDADVVVNDDLRDPQVDWPALRAEGFRVLRITAAPSVRMARLNTRADITRTDRSTSQLDLIPADAVLDNSGEIADHQAALRQLLRSWL